MTAAVKARQIGDIYVEMEMQHRHGVWVYDVTLNKSYGICVYRTERKCTYPAEEKRKADNCFYRYCSIAKNEVRI